MRIEIYAHTSPSGKRYIGLSRHGMAKRYRGHVSEALRGSAYPFHVAIRKYGAENFWHELLDVVHTEEGAARAERLWVRELQSHAPAGYNLTKGGDGILGHVFTDESRAKMRAARAGYTPSAAQLAALDAGRRAPRSPARLSKQSCSSKGKRVSAEARQKMSQAKKGKPLSAAHCARLSEVKRGVPKSEAHKQAIGVALRARRPG